MSQVRRGGRLTVEASTSSEVVAYAEESPPSPSSMERDGPGQSGWPRGQALSQKRHSLRGAMSHPLRGCRDARATLA